MMETRFLSSDKYTHNRNRSGIVLLLTLVLLVIMSIAGYQLTGRVRAHRHRDRYLVDYQIARYGCDSAIRYALAILEDINSPQLIVRDEEPDFSDLFSLTDAEYEQLLSEWTSQSDDSELQTENQFDSNDANGPNDVNGADDIDIDVNGIDSVKIAGQVNDFNDPNIFTIRGPYGPAWPLVTEPVELEIGEAKIRIEIEDENAKLPLGWSVLGDEKAQEEALKGFEAFCEWMAMDYSDIDSLKEQLGEIEETKSFKLEYKSVEQQRKENARTKKRQRRRRRSRKKRSTPTIISPQAHQADFSKLFHSSLINMEILAQATMVSETREESALKYLGTWASNKVNINTAPRHVLEAAFVFGGDGVEIANGIINRRRLKPFKDIDDLEKELFRYFGSIEKCKEYITTTSDFFSIRVSATSGLARACAVMAVTKQGNKMKQIAVISN